MDQLFMAHQLIRIQITQNGKEILKASAPEDAKEKVEELLLEKIGMHPAMDCSYDNIDKFVLSVQNKTAEETQQVYNQLEEEDKMKYYIFLTSDSDDDLEDEDIEQIEKLGLSDFEEGNTSVLKAMFNLEFNLVINGVTLPLL
ncbi:hypothetical protein [Priestia aryabhattai]